jgi:translocator assembly and maintenance protein 41
LDFVFAVENSLEWHTKNLKQNAHHYSVLRFGGPAFITRIQENYAAKIYYNPNVEVKGKVGTEEKDFRLLCEQGLFLPNRD